MPIIDSITASLYISRQGSIIPCRKAIHGSERSALSHDDRQRQAHLSGRVAAAPYPTRSRCAHHSNIADALSGINHDEDTNTDLKTLKACMLAGIQMSNRRPYSRLAGFNHDPAQTLFCRMNSYGTAGENPTIKSAVR
jgi:hypothetical protein